MKIQYIFIITYLVTICSIAESSETLSPKAPPVPAVITYYHKPITKALELFLPKVLIPYVCGYYGTPGDIVPVKYEENGKLKETEIIVPGAVWIERTLYATRAQICKALQQTNITLPKEYFWDYALGGIITEETGTLHETFPLTNRAYDPQHLSETLKSTPPFYIALAEWLDLPQKQESEKKINMIIESLFKKLGIPLISKFETVASTVQTRTYYSKTVIVACKEQPAYRLVGPQGVATIGVRQYIAAIPREQTK